MAEEFALDGIYTVSSVTQEVDSAEVILVNSATGRSVTLRPDSLLRGGKDDAYDTILGFVLDRQTVELVIRKVED